MTIWTYTIVDVDLIMSDYTAWDSIMPRRAFASVDAAAAALVADLNEAIGDANAGAEEPEDLTDEFESVQDLGLQPAEWGEGGEPTWLVSTVAGPYGALHTVAVYSMDLAE